MQGTYKKTEAPKFSGADLFFKKASYATNEGEKYVNQEGEIRHGYRVEQDLGQKNWGNITYFDGYDSEKNEMVTKELPLTFFKATSDTGKEFIKANAMFFNKMEQTNYMVKFNGKYHRISGTKKEFSGGKSTEILDGLSPYLVELMGLDLTKTTTTLPPMADTTTEVQYHEFDIKDWDAVTNGKLELKLYDKTEFFNVNKIQEIYRGDINASSMKNYVNTALAQAGFIEGTDFQGGFTFNQIEGGGYSMEFNAFGDNDAEQAAIAFSSIVSDTFDVVTQASKNKAYYGDARGSIDSKIIEELELENANPNMLSNDFIASKAGRYYKDIRAREGKRNLAILESLAGDRDNEKLRAFLKKNKSEDLLEKITDTQSLATVAQNITDRQLGELDTLQELIDFNIKVKDLEGAATIEGTRKREIRESQLITDIFPISEREIGNTLENFADYYIKDATDSPDGKKQAELLKVAVAGITDSEEQKKALGARLSTYLDKKELEQLENKRKTGNIFSSETSEIRQDTDTSIKSTAQLKKEGNERETAVKSIEFVEKEIEDKKTEIENLTKNSKNDIMLETILRPLKQQLLKLQETLVGYQQNLQMVDQGFATKETKLMETQINK